MIEINYLLTMGNIIQKMDPFLFGNNEYKKLKFIF